MNTTNEKKTFSENFTRADGSVDNVSSKKRGRRQTLAFLSHLSIDGATYAAQIEISDIHADIFPNKALHSIHFGCRCGLRQESM